MAVTDVTRVLAGAPALGAAPAASAAPAKSRGPSFGDVFRDALAQATSLQRDADRAIGELARGGPTSLHDTMLALAQADRSFDLMMQVRNKIVEAYEEVLRMQV